jgi:hypothetical protein
MKVPNSFVGSFHAVVLCYDTEDHGDDVMREWFDIDKVYVRADLTPKFAETFLFSHAILWW